MVLFGILAAKAAKKFLPTQFGDQVRRTKTAGRTILAAVTGKGVSANVKNPTVKAGLEVAASNPFSTAAVVAAPFSTAAKGAIASGFKSLSTTKKIVLGGAAVTGAGILGKSEKARVGTIRTAGELTPEKLISFGSDIGTAVDSPTARNISDIVKNNPVATAAAAGLAAIGVAGIVPAGAGAALGAAIGSRNKSSPVSQTAAASTAASGLPQTSKEPSKSASNVVSAPKQSSINPTRAPSKPKARKRTRRKTFKSCGKKKLDARINFRFRQG